MRVSIMTKRGSQKKESKEKEDLILSFIKATGYCSLSEIKKELKNNSIDIARQNIQIQLNKMVKNGLIKRKIVCSKKSAKSYLYSLDAIDLSIIKKRKVEVSENKQGFSLFELWPAISDSFPPVTCLI
jgi:predicted transcriptional regulator